MKYFVTSETVTTEGGITINTHHEFEKLDLDAILDIMSFIPKHIEKLGYEIVSKPVILNIIELDE